MGISQLAEQILNAKRKGYFVHVRKFAEKITIEYDDYSVDIYVNDKDKFEELSVIANAKIEEI